MKELLCLLGRTISSKGYLTLQVLEHSRIMPWITEKAPPMSYVFKADISFYQCCSGKHNVFTGHACKSKPRS